MQLMSEEQAQNVRGGGPGLIMFAGGVVTYGIVALIKGEWRPWKWC